jgi:hypothetical protein
LPAQLDVQPLEVPELPEVTAQRLATQWGAAAGQLPQLPPHPSSPHSLPAQLGEQLMAHWLSTQ